MIRANAPVSARAKEIINFLLRCGFAVWNLFVRTLAGFSSETKACSVDTASAMRKPHKTLNVRKNMKGVSFGLMNACPSSKGCVLKRRRSAQAVQVLNQRLASQYRHTPVNRKVMK